MAETRMEFWHRRGRALHKLSKAQLCALYRSLGGLGGVYPPEKWTKEEVLNAVADIEWDRLPDDAKKAAPEQMSPPCDTCGKGQDVSAHAHGGSHHYSYTAVSPGSDKEPVYIADPGKEWVYIADPGKEWVPSREPCATPECGRPYEHHRTWNLGHQYQAPAEVQPVTPAEATATDAPAAARCSSPDCTSPNCPFPGKCLAVRPAPLFRNSGPSVR